MKPFRAPLSLLLSAVWLFLFCPQVSARESGSPIRSLTVGSDPAGGVRATATLLFPAPPALVQSLLTDYHKWPELFEVRIRLAGVQERQGKVVTDLYIEHRLMPGERRLVCESEALPGGGLVTDLKSGDFKRYHRVWKLTSVNGGTQTEADFELVVEIETIVPDWLVALAMRRELEAHFRIVRDRVLERVQKGR
ncbi:MAG TPA: SRPBCC family protein [Nitrospiraceae bacterium]|nr:SRPBCC family protein [Nitrospiraceae bacterium]